MKTFGIWDEIVHDSPDQQKRIESSKKKECTPLQLNGEDGVFKGSKKNYFTTLSSCTCVDFSMRKLPCKHMYRLAFELNVFGSENVCDVDTQISERKRIEDILPSIATLSLAEQKEYQSIAFACGKGNEKTSDGIKVDINLAKKLIELGLAKDISTISKYIKKYKKDQLHKLIPAGMEVPKLKDDIICLLEKHIQLSDIPEYQDFRFLILPKEIEALAYSIERRIGKQYPNEKSVLDPETGKYLYYHYDPKSGDYVEYIPIGL